MTSKEWLDLKHGDRIKHVETGEIETIYIAFDNEQYIEGEKSLFPLSEFDHRDWEKYH